MKILGIYFINVKYFPFFPSKYIKSEPLFQPLESLNEDFSSKPYQPTRAIRLKCTKICRLLYVSCNVAHTYNAHSLWTKCVYLKTLTFFCWQDSSSQLSFLTRRGIEPLGQLIPFFG